MRPLTLAILAACLLASPAAAQTEPEPDQTRCEHAAARLDAAKQAGAKPEKRDKEFFDSCVQLLGCGKTSKATRERTLPPEARKSNLGMMQYIGRTCVLPK